MKEQSGAPLALGVLDVCNCAGMGRSMLRHHEENPRWPI
jgi:hypothetical protein